MKIGIISDIHANLAALQAVLEVLDREGCIKILCSGDIVGYGPQPRECLELVRERGILCVRGNHDDMMVSSARFKKLRDDVRNATQWTRTQLTDEQRRWLGSLPISLHYGGLELVHASHVLRPEWQYVIDHRSMAANFIFQSAPLAFNGHSHVPLLTLHKHGERPRMVELRDMQLPPHYRYMINVGSVGQPRDRNPMASFATYETRDRRVKPWRVRYDIDATQACIRAAGLPESLALRLAEGR